MLLANEYTPLADGNISTVPSALESADSELELTDSNSDSNANPAENSRAGTGLYSFSFGQTSHSLTKNIVS